MGDAIGVPLADGPTSPRLARTLTNDRIPPLDFTPSSLFLNLAISSIGTVLLIYGKKQSRLPQMFAGLAYLVYPYFIDDLWITLAIALAIAGALWWAVREGY
jgi:hypothetical protein